MWIFYAITASVLWGLEYTLTEKALNNVGLPMLLSLELLFGFFVMLTLALVSGSFETDLSKLLSSGKTMTLVGLIVVIFNVANALIVLSIGSRNATLAGLVEISYPLFIVLFSWILFKENNVNTGTIGGGALILLGLLLVYAFNQ